MCCECPAKTGVGRLSEGYNTQFVLMILIQSLFCGVVGHTRREGGNGPSMLMDTRPGFSPLKTGNWPIIWLLNQHTCTTIPHVV